MRGSAGKSFPIPRVFLPDPEQEFQQIISDSVIPKPAGGGAGRLRIQRENHGILGMSGIWRAENRECRSGIHPGAGEKGIPTSHVSRGRERAGMAGRAPKAWKIPGFPERGVQPIPKIPLPALESIRGIPGIHGIPAGPALGVGSW